MVKEVWEAVRNDQNLAQLRDALSKTMSTLGAWSKKFGSVTHDLAKSRSQLEELMHMNADRQDIRRVTGKMNGLLYQEEMLWLQRSRITWLKEGDRKTKYFQSKAVWRARKNKIRELTDSIGVVHSDFETMGMLANEYFQNIFSADTSLDASPVLDLLDTRVSIEDKIKLCAPFSDNVSNRAA